MLCSVGKGRCVERVCIHTYILTPIHDDYANIYSLVSLIKDDGNTDAGMNALEHHISPILQQQMCLPSDLPIKLVLSICSQIVHFFSHFMFKWNIIFLNGYFFSAVRKECGQASVIFNSCFTCSNNVDSTLFQFWLYLFLLKKLFIKKLMHQAKGDSERTASSDGRICFKIFLKRIHTYILSNYSG